ncbi:hypothetical protein ACJX0J_030030 [Zea mays]
MPMAQSDNQILMALQEALKVKTEKLNQGGIGISLGNTEMRVFFGIVGVYDIGAIDEEDGFIWALFANDFLAELIDDLDKKAEFTCLSPNEFNTKAFANDRLAKNEILIANFTMDEDFHKNSLPVHNLNFGRKKVKVNDGVCPFFEYDLHYSLIFGCGIGGLGDDCSLFFWQGGSSKTRYMLARGLGMASVFYSHQLLYGAIIVIWNITPSRGKLEIFNQSHMFSFYFPSFFLLKSTIIRDINTLIIYRFDRSPPARIYIMVAHESAAQERTPS